MIFIEELKTALSKKSPLYIKVKVIPKSPANEIVEVMADGTYKIRIAAPAEGGKANRELVRFIKKILSASDVTIISGAAERTKLLKIIHHQIRERRY
ncbi:MAG: DUF167 domain-containing protein [Candidatus Peregrinibacteria bacterium]